MKHFYEEIDGPHGENNKKELAIKNGDTPNSKYHHYLSLGQFVKDSRGKEYFEEELFEIDNKSCLKMIEALTQVMRRNDWIAENK